MGRYILIAKYIICYLISLVFSSICFHLSYDFIINGRVLPCLGATFMTYVFYTAAEACEIILEMLLAVQQP